MLSQHFKNPKEQTDFFIALAVIFLAGGMIIYYSLGYFKMPVLADLTEEVPEEMVVEGHRYLAVNEEEMLEIESTKKIHKSKIVEDVPVVVAPVVSIKDSIQILPESTDLEKIIAEEKISHEATKPEKAIEPLENKELKVETDDVEKSTRESFNPTLEAVKKRAAEEKKVKEQQPSKKKKRVRKKRKARKQAVDKPLPIDKGCIILVGAYNSSKGIRKLINKLEMDGYRIFKAPYKGTTRIGVFHPCDDSIGDELKKIRRKFAKDAVILKSE